MRRIRQRSRWLWRTAAFGGLLGWTAAALPQHTVVQEAGGGREIELNYNAAGQVVETRTVDAAGRLQGRVDYEYRPGFLVPQQTTTSYWPDGKAVRSVARESYDENSNFTSEVVELFDESGKHSSGHKLAHDPFTGIYRCANWDVAAQDYQRAACPEGEESGGAPQEAQELSYDEVARQCDRARQALREEQKVRRMQPETPVQPPITTTNREIGVILPAQLRRGERVSGSVVEDPQTYDRMPGLRVVRMTLPFESPGEAATLRGWTIAAAGKSPQPADGPVTFTVPLRAAEFSLTLRRAGNEGVSRSVSVTPGRDGKPSVERPASFEAAALCLKGDLCPVVGPFSGASSRTVAVFGSQPAPAVAPILAETEDTAYLRVPEGAPKGLTYLFVADGSRMAALPVDVAEWRFTPPRLVVQAGQPLLVHVYLSGPEDLPDDEWRAGTFPAGASLERARRLVPGFALPPDEKQGVILLVVQNASSDMVSLRGSKHQTFAFRLTPASFTTGLFKYQFVVESAKSGSFALRVSVLPFLAPVAGREFAIQPDAPTR